MYKPNKPIKLKSDKTNQPGLIFDKFQSHMTK